MKAANPRPRTRPSRHVLETLLALGGLLASGAEATPSTRAGSATEVAQALDAPLQGPSAGPRVAGPVRVVDEDALALGQNARFKYDSAGTLVSMTGYDPFVLTEGVRGGARFTIAFLLPEGAQVADLTFDPSSRTNPSTMLVESRPDPRAAKRVAERFYPATDGRRWVGFRCRVREALVDGPHRLAWTLTFSSYPTRAEREQHQFVVFRDLQGLGQGLTANSWDLYLEEPERPGPSTDRTVLFALLLFPISALALVLWSRPNRTRA